MADFSVLGPPPLDDPDLRQQCVLEALVQCSETLVVVVENVVHIIGRLLGGFDGLCSAGDEFNDLIALGENPQQRRNNRLNRVTDFRHDNLRAAFFFVANGIAAIVLQRLGTVRRDEPVDVIHGIVDGRFHRCLELVHRHRVIVVRVVPERMVLIFVFFAFTQHVCGTAVGDAARKLSQCHVISSSLWERPSLAQRP